jgi:hypothetical protein
MCIVLVTLHCAVAGKAAASTAVKDRAMIRKFFTVFLYRSGRQFHCAIPWHSSNSNTIPRAHDCLGERRMKQAAIAFQIAGRFCFERAWLHPCRKHILMKVSGL